METQSVRALLRDAFSHSLRQVHATHAIKDRIRLDDNVLHVYGNMNKTGETFHYDLSRYERIFVLGCGKASGAMARGLYEIPGDRIAGGHVVVKDGHSHSSSIGPISVSEASHPTPDWRGEEAALQAIQIMRRATHGDLIISLISGGGSALWTAPEEGISVEELRKTTDILLAAGTDIEQTNTIRKHISRIKGGKAAAHAFPAQVLVLLLSDVLGDKIDTIASGPFAPDGTTYDDARKIISRYRLHGKMPSSVIRHLEKGAAGCIEDMPDEKNVIFTNVRHVIVANNDMAQAAAENHLNKNAIQTVLIETAVIGEVDRAAGDYVRRVAALQTGQSRPLCVVSGGETTVTLGRVHGKGGRNQHFALKVAEFLQGKYPRFALLSCGTDGTDGPTNATGALVDHTTLARCREKMLDYSAALEHFDTYPLLDALGDLVITGPTGTNVVDLQLLMLWDK